MYRLIYQTKAMKLYKIKFNLQIIQSSRKSIKIVVIISLSILLKIIYNFKEDC